MRFSLLPIILVGFAGNAAFDLIQRNMILTREVFQHMRQMGDGLGLAHEIVIQGGCTSVAPFRIPKVSFAVTLQIHEDHARRVQKIPW